MPPIDGLQLICPSVSMLWVSSSVLQPMRADGEGGFGAGVAAADDDDVEFFGIEHGVGAVAGRRGSGDDQGRDFTGRCNSLPASAHWLRCVRPVMQSRA